MSPDEPIHLTRRDRVAFACRVAGTLAGLALVVAALAAGEQHRAWVIALFGLVAVGGALAYHLSTSVVPCPRCGARLANFGIASAEADRKLFRCSRCGAAAYLREGFYWQRDVAG